MKIPKIRLIATDLDGTLLRDDKTIDEKTKERLIQAQKQGIIIVIATGRHKSGIDFVTKPLQLEQHGNNYVAGINGEIIYSYKNKEYFVDQVLCDKDAQIIRRTVKRFSCEAIYFCGYDMYDQISWWLKIKKLLYSLLFRKPADYGLKGAKHNFIELHKEHTFTQDINKVVFTQTKRFFDKHLEEMRKELCDYDLLKVGPGWIELMPKGVNKASAILKIAEANGISKEEILCFGDAENDLSMMQQIPHSIAMGNAMNIVKEAAFDICDSNMEAGIAKALDKYIFQKTS